MREGQAFAKKLEADFAVSAELEEPDPDADVPVLLKNNQFGAICEGILASFGLPAKGEMDPSFITACFYVFLFGLMLSDAAYGLIVALACGCAAEIPADGGELKKSLQLFFWCGLSTIFWGVMFGGFFGDAVDVDLPDLLRQGDHAEAALVRPADGPDAAAGLLHALWPDPPADGPGPQGLYVREA
ncbi:MAG: hypothetical protein V8S89_02685 [Oscillospiraceae bacterium]